jgi:transposase
MTHINKNARASVILRVMDEVENSPLSINQYFKEKKVPFGRAQYFLYKKVLREKGAKGLHDQRGEGNNLKFTNEMKTFVKGLLGYNQSITSSEVKNAIENEFGIAISNTVINDFRRENDLSWIRPESDRKPLDESGASEIAIALALDTGLVDAIADSICLCVQKNSMIFQRR